MKSDVTQKEQEAISRLSRHAFESINGVRPIWLSTMYRPQCEQPLPVVLLDAAIRHKRLIDDHMVKVVIVNQFSVKPD